ncbi:MAG: hypothetical protein SFT93_05450 [Rickettsiaceae bacterium]|nr:hypothetical protein [Rickettsiaceae bacterium]
MRFIIFCVLLTFAQKSFSRINETNSLDLSTLKSILVANPSDINTQGQQNNEIDNEIEIENLKFESKGNNSKPFSIKAKKGVKTQEQNYHMYDVSAEVNLGQNSLILHSDSGHYNNLSKTLFLANQVNGKYIDYDFSAKNVEADLENREIKSSSSIKISSDKLITESDTFEATKTEIIILKGNVKSIFFIN